jgi:two-component system, sensor histidine kinase
VAEHSRQHRRRDFRPHAESLRQAAGAVGLLMRSAHHIRSAWRATAERLRLSSQSDDEVANLEHLKDAHWQIAESEARMRELLDSQQHLIVRRDCEGRVLFANRAYREAFAVTDADIAGKRFRPEVVKRDTPSSVAGGCRRYSENLETVRGARWVLWEEQSFKSQSGAIDTLFVGRDVTDERRFAAELSEARDQALSANRAKSRFLASMSHEIRTPMNGILGMASLLAETEQSSEQASYTRAIDQSARALLALIDEILDFSKIEAGRLDLAADCFSLRACVESAIELLKPKANAKALSLDLRIADSTPSMVIGDPLRVRQIVLNLVSNAIKFTDTGGVDVYVRPNPISAETSASVLLDIVVADTGIGIGSDEISGLFVEFEQVDDGRRRRQSGTGLGLAISKRLALAMGGDIRVSSALGAGATFVATLRLCTVPMNAIPSVSQSDSASAHLPVALTQQPIGIRPPHILIVEDNDINALLARRVCEKAGCVVDHVSNGQLAIAAVAKAQNGMAAAYDLILMDIFLPELDGIEATRAIKTMFETPDSTVEARCPPIIALTANAFAEDRARCFEAGMDDYLSKPFDMAQLTSLMARWLPSLRSPAPS